MVNFLKTKDIKAYKNNKLLKGELTIADNGLFYLCFDKKHGFERLYFFIDTLKSKKSNGTINNFKMDTNSIQFCYKGYWDSESNKGFKIIEVNYSFKIIFNNSNEFDKFKNRIELCQNKKYSSTSCQIRSLSDTKIKIVNKTEKKITFTQKIFKKLSVKL